MPKKKSYITITDQFCGAGGSSQGARNYGRSIGGGVEIKLALNHWKLAIDTHISNFPDTDHDCTDISASDPRRYSSTDILITSPECTNHSLAKGQKIVKAQLDLFDKGILDPAAERSRATMWDVPRFAEYHSYNIIIVENVVDARKWVMWEAWLMAMDALGYFHKCCYFNSMHFHPTPQSRDRMYIVFWKKGNTAPDLDYHPRAYCSTCTHDIEAVQTWKAHKYGKFKTQYVYRCPVHHEVVTPYYFAAFNAIDWSDIGTRIGDRSKPLSDNTVRRIQYGLDKYCSEPFQVINYSPGYSKPMTDPIGTVTTNDHHAVCHPFIVNDQHSTGTECRVKRVSAELNTLATQQHFKLVMPMVMNTDHSKDKNVGKIFKATSGLPTQTTSQELSLITPFMIKTEYQENGSRVKKVTDAFGTQSTHHNTGLVMPILVENKKNSKSRQVSEPLSTLTTKDYHGIITTESWKSFISYYYNGSNVASYVSEAIRTLTANDRAYMINYQQPNIQDCYYRMIKPPEVKKAMAFDNDYIILGSGKDQVKQCGNAVTPPVMEWLVGQCVKSLAS